MDVDHHSFKKSLVTSKSTQWFVLMKGEFLTEVDIRLSEAHDKVCAICFKSNVRQSQWCGSSTGVKEMIVPPPGYYIHSLHGLCTGRSCVNIGGYFVPLALAMPDEAFYCDHGISRPIGAATIDHSLHQSFRYIPNRIKARVVSLNQGGLDHLWSLSPIDFQRYLATTESPLDEGEFMLDFLDNELPTELRACLGSGGFITSIQLVTTHRTTEWFGPGPSEGSTVESRAGSDEPAATHIGGFEGVVADGQIQALAVHYCSAPDP